MSLAPRFGHSLTSKKSFQSPTRNKSWKSWTKIPAFLIQFSQILLGKLFIDSDLISPWLSGLLSHGNLLNTWLSPVSTLSSQQTRHGHQREMISHRHNLVTILLRLSWVCDTAKYHIGPTWHDAWQSWHCNVMCDATRRRVIEQYAALLQNLVCIIIKINWMRRVLISFIFCCDMYSLWSSIIARHKKIMRPTTTGHLREQIFELMLQWMRADHLFSVSGCGYQGTRVRAQEGSKIKSILFVKLIKTRTITTSIVLIGGIYGEIWYRGSRRIRLSWTLNTYFSREYQ